MGRTAASPIIVDQINAAGGVKGRKIEIVIRDTQGDPTKAVNATQEMISQRQGARHLGPEQFRRVRWPPRRSWRARKHTQHSSCVA